MTQGHDQIIAEYRDADFNRRLHMYLQFPQLRSEFMIMDQNDRNTDLGADFKLRRNPLASQLSVVLCSAADCFKKFFSIPAV